MGPKAPSPGTVVIPAAAAPTMFQSVTPLESYEDIAGQLKRIQAETGKIQEQRFQEVGTPAELGARQAGRRVQEVASYLSALPSGDKYLQQTTGQVDKYAPAKQAAQENLTEAQKAYFEALQKSGEKPEATIAETPSWAKRTVT